MEYVLQLGDRTRQNMAVLTLREFDLKRSAVDVFFNFLASPAQDLVDANILPAGQVQDFTTIQSQIFDRDAQGMFIRENVSIEANGVPLDPDRPFIEAFKLAERDGAQYFRCELAVVSGSSQGDAPQDQDVRSQQQIQLFAKIMFLHQLAVGYEIDVTKEYPELAESIAEAEKNGWIEVDVKKVAYRLTPEGKRVYDGYLAEAQELIKRYDIFGDVDVDSSGQVRFDTGFGKDLRIPVMELEGVDPYIARFLIGINDGEWNQLSNWPDLYRDLNWYKSVFEIIECAPAIEEIGRQTLLKIVDEGRAHLRIDSRFR